MVAVPAKETGTSQLWRTSWRDQNGIQPAAFYHQPKRGSTVALYVSLMSFCRQAKWTCLWEEFVGPFQQRKRPLVQRHLSVLLLTVDCWHQPSSCPLQRIDMPRNCSLLKARLGLHACGCCVCETACADFTGYRRRGGGPLGIRAVGGTR